MTAIDNPFNLLNYFLSVESLINKGSHTAIEFQGIQITYNKLREAVDICAQQLFSFGVKEGDRVALLLYDSPEFVAYFLATVGLKAICVPINTFLSVDDIHFILKDSGSTLVIVEQQLKQKIEPQESDNEASELMSILILDESAADETCLRGMPLLSRRSVYLDLPCVEEFQSIYNPFLEISDTVFNASMEPIFTESLFISLSSITRDTPAFILYTSGSTGTPKGALHTHGNVQAVVNCFGKDVLKLQPTDKIFSASRLFFAYGLGNSLSFPLAAGATVILESKKPTAKIIARIFSEQRPTIFFAVPTVYRALLDLYASGVSVDTSSLRMCVSAGEALPTTIFEEWLSTFGMTLLDGIGSTEMLHMFISNRGSAAKAGSSGQVVVGYEAEILDYSGYQTAIGEQGNLWVKGSSAMTGYWKREDLTANVRRDGWMKTGDVYRKDGEGYYYHIGRSDDLFKVNGLWVSPLEIESVLLCHPEVVEAAVVASADEKGLATVKAYLVIRKGSETLKKELFEFAGARLPLYKTPTLFEFVKEMPRTSTGKIQRFKLRG